MLKRGHYVFDDEAGDSAAERCRELLRIAVAMAENAGLSSDAVINIVRKALAKDGRLTSE